MFSAIGYCDTCGRQAFSQTELGQKCNDPTAEGSCKGLIIDGSAPVILRGEKAVAQALASSPALSGHPDERREVFRILGHDVQYVDEQLQPGETLIAEAGALLFMAEGIEMATVFGDGSPAGGGLAGALINPIRRAMAGESPLLTTFTNRSSRRRRLAFAAPHTGSIIPIELSCFGGEVHCQRGSFLCGTAGLTIAPGVHRNVAATLVANEGFITQKIRGTGVVFIHAGGSVIEYDLEDGEEIFVETGAMVAWQGDMILDIKFHSNLKNLLFANEGVALSHLRGPGRVWIQPLPFNKLARRIVHAAPQEKKPS